MKLPFSFISCSASCFSKSAREIYNGFEAADTPSAAQKTQKAENSDAPAKIDFSKDGAGQIRKASDYRQIYVYESGKTPDGYTDVKKADYDTNGERLDRAERTKLAEFRAGMSEKINAYSQKPGATIDQASLAKLFGESYKDYALYLKFAPQIVQSINAANKKVREEYAASKKPITSMEVNAAIDSAFQEIIATNPEARPLENSIWRSIAERPSPEHITTITTPEGASTIWINQDGSIRVDQHSEQNTYGKFLAAVDADLAKLKNPNPDQVAAAVSSHLSPEVQAQLKTMLPNKNAVLHLATIKLAGGTPADVLIYGDGKLNVNPYSR